MLHTLRIWNVAEEVISILQMENEAKECQATGSCL